MTSYRDDYGPRGGYRNGDYDPYSTRDPYRGTDPYRDAGRPAPRNDDPYRDSRPPPREDPYGYNRQTSRNDYTTQSLNRGDYRDRSEDPYGRSPRVANGYGPARDDYRGGGPTYATVDRSARQNNAGRSGSGALYDLDHLATFTVGPKQGLIHPEDGIRKLKQMEVTTGIWTMRCQLLIDPYYLVIKDMQTAEEMERFPLNDVVNPTAVMTNSQRDVYNNVLLFMVNDDPRKGTGSSEMHIFQCVSKPAQEIVDEIKMAKSGRSGPPAGRYEPPPPMNGPNPDRDRYHLAAERSAMATQAYQPGPAPGAAFKQSMDTQSTLSESTDMEVQMLNHCFDDIEIFVGRLQSAADAFRELEMRRQRRDKGRSRREMGDGMLTMRARPPPAREFISILQKFKLAFNLLAKLKAHIHDPNAPELVHFLFTPLSLIVEASKDPHQGTPDLASKVVTPLLSHDAKELLFNCLTSKESELWISLGEAWTLTSDQWRGHVQPYRPRFSDGWEPVLPNFDSQPVITTLQPPPAPPEPQIHQRPSPRDEDPYYRSDGPSRNPLYQDDPYRPLPRREPERPPQQEPFRSYVDSHVERNRENMMREIAERDNRRDFNQRPASPPPVSPKPPRAAPPMQSADEQRLLRDAAQKGSKVVEASAARVGRNTKELTIERGELLEVLDKSKNWWKLRNAKGQVGHAPYTILNEVNPSDMLRR